MIVMELRNVIDCVGIILLVGEVLKYRILLGFVFFFVRLCDIVMFNSRCLIGYGFDRCKIGVWELLIDCVYLCGRFVGRFLSLDCVWLLVKVFVV